MTEKKKKSGRGKQAPDKTAAEYYELKTGAVDDLINANVTNTPAVSEKELRKYRRRSVRNMPDGLKFFLLKWWFAGVVCWFFLIGLGMYGIRTLDMMLIMGVVTGLLWDLPVNIFIRLKAEKKDFSRYMMFPKTGVGAGVLNALYGILLVYLTAQTYAAADMVLQAAGDSTLLSVGPILFGIFTAGWDWILLKCRRIGKNILADARRSAAGENRKQKTGGR